MARKIFCDGCDKELDIEKGTTDARVGLTAKFHTEAGLGQFELGPWDLCGICIHKLKAVSDPKRWERFGGRVVRDKS